MKGKYIVTSLAKRPASNAERCFYCHEAIGDHHLEDCVLVIKKVLVRVVVEYEMDMPANWDKNQVEFRLNESSYCASNLLDDLKEFEKENGCLCAFVHYEYLRDVGEPYLEEG